MTPRRKGPALEDVLGALSDPTRRQVVEILARGPRRASELADELGQSRPGMSRHLRVLRAARLVREEGDEADGRARLLTLERAALDPVRNWVDELEGFWSAQLASFKTLAEAHAATPERSRRKKAS